MTRIGITALLGAGAIVGLAAAAVADPYLVAVLQGLDKVTARVSTIEAPVGQTVSFGTLALSSHRGVASLGVVLTIGMLLTVLCNLVVLPALIALRRQAAEVR